MLAIGLHLEGEPTLQRYHRAQVGAPVVVLADNSGEIVVKAGRRGAEGSEVARPLAPQIGDLGGRPVARGSDARDELGRLARPVRLNLSEHVGRALQHCSDLDRIRRE